MARGTSSVNIVIHLELSEAEAQWLRSYLQNPLVDGEPKYDEEFRKSIFNAIAIGRK